MSQCMSNTGQHSIRDTSVGTTISKNSNVGDSTVCVGNSENNHTLKDFQVGHPICKSGGLFVIGRLAHMQ